MTTTSTLAPKPRISSIDALRGFALLGIFIWHCMERFDLGGRPTIDLAFWKGLDNLVYDTLSFLFRGKAYAIFSLLFGLSFFMQMDAQAQKGKDFSLRFLWRMVILFALGYVNGLFYMGEFFMVYAILGVLLIPLNKVPTKWLVVIMALLFLQIPDIVKFIGLFVDSDAPAKTSTVGKYMGQLYVQAYKIFSNGSFWDVIKFNAYDGQVAKLLWVYRVSRYLQLLGLFIAGLLIGRMGIHKDVEKMKHYSAKMLPYAAGLFVVFYVLNRYLADFGLEGKTLSTCRTIFTSYANLGMTMVYICGFTLLYHYRKCWQRALDRIAPVGRMSVTNYFMQSIVGICLFYGFGLGLSKLSFAWSFMIGLAFCAVQIAYSNWWMKRFHYGPLEGLWRTLIWFRPVKMRRTV